MIDYELFCKIRHLKEHEGLNAHQIAGELAMDPRTVSKWLTRERFCPRKVSLRSSKLDPFKNEIARMLQSHAFTAAQVLVRVARAGLYRRLQYRKRLRAKHPATEEPAPT